MNEQPGKNPLMPDLEQFKQMSVEQKALLFTSLPLSVQKFFVGASTFATFAPASMLQPVSELDNIQFAEAQQFLADTAYLQIDDKSRFNIPAEMRSFVNNDLLKIWQEQKRKSQE